MFVCGERNQYPPIGKGGHPPLQALLGPGSRCANAGTHFTQFLLSLFGGGMDVLGDAFRSRFFGTHGFILSQLAPPKTPLRQIVIKQSEWLLAAQLNTVSPVLASLTDQAISSACSPGVPHAFGTCTGALFPTTFLASVDDATSN